MAQSKHWGIGLIVTVGCGGFVTAAEPPSLVWETTVSITDELEGGDDLVVDSQGNVVVLGNLGREQDFFVARFDPSGNFLWRRIIGGNRLDFATGLTVDAAGDIYIAGRTLSSDFPVRSAYQNTLNGHSDAFVMKLAAGTGETIISTYFGGSRGEWAWDIALGPDGSAYVVGSTDSADFETMNPIQASLNLTRCFCEDVFVTRFSPQLDSVLFSTYLGGGSDDAAHEIEVDDAGNMYLAGNTRSEDWPTMNPFQEGFGGDDFDVFAAKISADETLAYSTYLGGEDWDVIRGMDIDAAGHQYVAGSTRSIAYPTTPEAFQPDFIGGIRACPVPFGPVNNCFDFFVTKLGTGGDTLSYSTYLGGHQEDHPANIVVDDLGRAHVIGHTFSDDFPMDAPFANVLAIRLTADGGGLDYIVAHATPHSNGGSGVDVVGDDLFITTSVGIPYDTYVAKFSPDCVRNPTWQCDGDVDGDAQVNPVDSGLIQAAFGSIDDGDLCQYDVDCDGLINPVDSGIVQSLFGTCEEPRSTCQ